MLITLCYGMKYYSRNNKNFKLMKLARISKVANEMLSSVKDKNKDENSYLLNYNPI